MTFSKPSHLSGDAESDPLPLAPTDPWGTKRAENLITSLTGILSARVVVTPRAR